MANINQVITLGVGTPADIPHFILFGLSPIFVIGVQENVSITENAVVLVQPAALLVSINADNLDVWVKGVKIYA